MGLAWAEFVTTSIDSLPTSKLNSECILWDHYAKGAGESKLNGNMISLLSFVLTGREERFFDKFVVSPDNQLLVFLGKDGYMPLVSNKVGDIYFCYQGLIKLL